MKWMSFRVRTNEESEDIIISYLEDIGLEGAQIEDNAPLSAADKEQMFIDAPELEPDEKDTGIEAGAAYLNFFLEIDDENMLTVELPDDNGEYVKVKKTPEEIEEQIKEKEGKKIIKNIDQGAFVCALAINGKKFTSEKFSDFINDLGVKGTSHIQFIIGGSLGLHESVLELTDAQISFSDMTFPHQMMRVILLEQIYRGYKIISGEPYHK